MEKQKDLQEEKVFELIVLKQQVTHTHKEQIQEARFATLSKRQLLCLLQVKEVEVWWVLMKGEAGATRAKKRGLTQRAELGGLPGGSNPHSQKNPGTSTTRLYFIRAKLILII